MRATKGEEGKENKTVCGPTVDVEPVVLLLLGDFLIPLKFSWLLPRFGGGEGGTTTPPGDARGGGSGGGPVGGISGGTRPVMLERLFRFGSGGGRVSWGRGGGEGVAGVALPSLESALRLLGREVGGWKRKRAMAVSLG